ncbi:MAG: type III pantothenate kinase [Fusobacteria bacterium]|nr:MAG: type III pantothenate kinase [Fusobacteriota bacterium]KAF0230173.1 MAG: type III pantothenate [Fusobacteriota bacterium]
MLLIIDIGNTSMMFGVFHKNELKEKFTIKSHKTVTSDDLGVSIIQYLSLFNLDKKQIEAVVIASVVPQLTETLETAIKDYLEIPTYIVGSNLNIDLDSSSYKSQAGIDRLINVFGGISKYGKSLIIIDIGTALTIDVADNNGAFIGGIIFPGIHSLNQALSKDTAKLPIVDLERPGHIIGTSTEDCILSGVYYGYIYAIEGMIEKMKAELPYSVTVIATGGYSSLLKDCNNIDIFDENLTLDGIRLIYENRTISPLAD